MEAPERIYLSAVDLEEVGYLLSKSNDRDDIEYVRTDAFIEKAISYIQQHWIWDTKIIEDFKNYMEE